LRLCEEGEELGHEKPPKRRGPRHSSDTASQ
jgi:hypothetical protein